jgi:hypothetical protein
VAPAPPATRGLAAQPINQPVELVDRERGWGGKARSGRAADDR